MLISNEETQSVSIESIDEPISSDYFWVIDLEEQDFRLSKLILLEEFVTPTLTLSVLGFPIQIPSEWNLLVYSPETSIVDMIQISDAARGQFSAFLLNHKNNKVIENYIKVIDYSPSSIIRVPSFNKNTMMCHPIGDFGWIMIAPTDTYNKYLRDIVTVGTFLH